MRTRRRSASAQAVDRSFEAANARAKARAGLTAIAIFLVFASVVGVLWYGAQDVLSGLMTGGRLSQFVLYAVLAATAVGGLSETWGEIAQCMGAAERLSELLQVQSQDQIAAQAEAVARAGARRDRLSRRVLLLSVAARDERARSVELQRVAGRAGRACRSVGRGQDHDLRAAAAVLRCRPGQGRGRRRCR